MKVINGSTLSDEELAELAQTMVDTHGEAARDVVNRHIDETNAASEFAEHSKWVAVSLGVLKLLRPDRPGASR